MTNFAGAQAQAKKFANQNDQSSDVQEVRENIKDLGDSVGHMASRQYERAQDVATDAIQETGDAIQRNPLTAIGIGFGVGFLFGLAMGGRSLNLQQVPEALSVERARPPPDRILRGLHAFKNGTITCDSS